MMNKLILIAGAAALATTAPALAKPDHGNGEGKGHGQKRGDFDRHFNGYHYGYNAACPPGLAKKHNGCMAPGQAKKRYKLGYRLPSGYGGYTSYHRIPYDLRRQYDLDPNNRYIYDNNYLYQVDPRTQLITQVLRAIIR